MLLVVWCMAQPVAQCCGRFIWLVNARLRSTLLLLFTCMCLLAISVASPAQAAANLLVNGDFDTPLLPNLNANNIQGTAWSSWTGTVQINPIHVDGTGYTLGPDNANSGVQYIDLYGPGSMSQTFTLGSAQTIYFGASFANRATSDPTYVSPAPTLQILNSSSVVVATGSTVTLTKAMGDEGWYPSTGSVSLAAGTYTMKIAFGDFGHVDTAFVRTTTLAVQKITTGGSGGPFTFSQTNLASAPGSITTSAAGTPTPTSPTAINVTTMGTAITLTETPAAGFVLAAASCTDASSALTGNTGSFGSLSGNVLTILAANVKAGADFTCTFTNTKLPTMTLTKISSGGVGSFTFTGTNGWANQTITTVTSGTGVTGTTQTLTAASTATTITETIPAGYILTSATCSGMGTGGTATPTLATGALVLNAAAAAAGSNIACTFTNTKLVPAMTVVKSASTPGPVSVGTVITYTFRIKNTGNTPITGITVGETFNGKGTPPVPGNESLSLDVAPTGDSTDLVSNNGSWEVLGPGDEVTFTAPYTVTQDDVDLLQ